ncbi:type 2 lanthipeptide synthetase LanM family protein [Lentzea sp. NPDC051838]|uniref:type 2 lanthipeptide synthetase LanM family protein n=1 Tax=Lentzea sp. NPDC051838 TaxID=3154849 RepID=UPI00344501CA
MEIACRVTPAPTDVFAHVVAPWVDAASARLHRNLAALPREAVDPKALVAETARHLTTRLVRLATPVLATHQPITDYPVLIRELDRERDTAVDTITEIATRYAADQDRLTVTLLKTKARVQAIRPAGDRHQGGRATAILELADGQRVVYKPRGVQAHLALSRVIELVNDLVDLGLATVKCEDSGGHGWTEHVEPAPLPSPDATTYYHRLGGLLAVLHLVRATDMHHQNMITRADQPLLIDVETLFQSQLPGERPDPATVALGRSVARTGILPAIAGRHGLTDISAAGGDAGQETASDEITEGAANRPTWQGRPVEPADHADAFLAGFRTTYDAISLHRKEFTAVLTRYASIEVRVVPRPTRQYADLITAVRAPEFLQNAETRLNALKTACATDFLPGLAELEAGELDTGDIPLFTARADGHDLQSAQGKLGNAVTNSGLEDALACLDRFDEFDREDQEWVIAASLASRRVAVTGAGHGRVHQHLVGTDEVLSAACSVADRIVTTSFGTDRINWIGLEPVGDTRWLVLPMGAGLAHGYTGVALFLAQLGRISDVCRYTDVARKALNAVPDLLNGLKGNDDLIAAVGSGGLTGFAGIGYALARIAKLLNDDEVARWARATVPLTEAAAEFEPEHGLVAAMRALDQEIGCSDARDLADRYQDEPASPVQWCQHDASEWTDDDLSLCHGELGHADVSVHGWSAATRHRRTGEVLAALRRDGPRCVTPDRVPTPGLLTGLAGIGIGLLRLGFPEQTPSVLRHEPAP